MCSNLAFESVSLTLLFEEEMDKSYYLKRKLLEKIARI